MGQRGDVVFESGSSKVNRKKEKHNLFGNFYLLRGVNNYHSSRQKIIFLHKHINSSIVVG